LVKFYPTKAGLLCDKVGMSWDTINGTPFFRRTSPGKLVPGIPVIRGNARLGHPTSAF